MIRLQKDSQTKTLYKLLNKWANSYNPTNRNWKCYSYKLDEICHILKAGGWHPNKEELTELIIYRLKQQQPQLTNKDRFIRKIASNLAEEIIHSIENHITLCENIFIDLNDYI